MITLLPKGGVQLSSNAEPMARSGWIAIRRSASQPNLIPTMNTPEGLNPKNAVRVAVFAVLAAFAVPEESSAADANRKTIQVAVATAVDCTGKKGMELITCMTEQSKLRGEQARVNIEKSERGIKESNASIEKSERGIAETTASVLKGAADETGVQISD